MTNLEGAEPVAVLQEPIAGFDRAAAVPAPEISPDYQILRDRLPRLRLLAGSAVGVGCLVLAQWLHPGGVSPIAAPSDPVAWRTAIVAGIVGIWLVPGLWLSAVMMHTGPGPAAWLATRIGTTLAWYALVGPVIHQSSQGSRVTTGVIVVATAAATAAVCLGVALGLLRRPADPRLRILWAAVAGALCAQAAIWLAMQLWTYDMNYEPIRRLGWLIVLVCALLTIVGMHNRPALPSVQNPRHTWKVLVSLAVIEITAVALLVTGGRWSPEQRMPSAFSAEQIIQAPSDDLEFALTAISPEGAELIQRAVFTASDDTGRPVPVRAFLQFGDRTADRATLVVLLDPTSRPLLCKRTVAASEEGVPVKLTLHDQASGLLVQAVIPAGWCGK
jgi:hypothetical protein